MMQHRALFHSFLFYTGRRHLSQVGREGAHKGDRYLDGRAPLSSPVRTQTKPGSILVCCSGGSSITTCSSCTLTISPAGHSREQSWRMRQGLSPGRMWMRWVAGRKPTCPLVQHLSRHQSWSVESSK